MTSNPGVEGQLLAGLGRFSVFLACCALVLCLADPVALLVSFIALILGGFSATAGKLRHVVIDSIVVAASIVLVFLVFPPAPEVAWVDRLILGARVFAPPYLVAYGLAAFGLWRVRRRSGLLPTP